MSQTVWRFPIPPDDVALVPMPDGAELLCAGAQGGEVCVWARVNPSAPLRSRRLRVAGTGHSEARGGYVGTAWLAGEQRAHHVFDCGWSA